MALALGWMAACAGCMRPAPPLDPQDAPAAAAEAVRVILERTQPAAAAPLASPPSALAVEPVTVTVWYPDHPLMRRLASPAARADFSQAHPGVTLEAQGIGDWMYAVQKLTVHLAGGGLPDIAVVRRDLLAQLAPSGRIVALNSLVGEAFLEDLEPPVLEAFSLEGRLVALPADAFHSVLYTDAGHALPHLDDLLAAETNDGAVIGHLPFLETLWALGGDVLDGPAVSIHQPASARAFALMHALYAPATGRAERYAVFDETHGLSVYLAGRVPMTAASSRTIARVLEQRPDTRIQAIPGDGGGVSRWGEYAIVVFEDAAPKGAAIAAVLDFLTGPALQGAEALAIGSPPVRRGVRASLGESHVFLDTFRAARATPLTPGWGEVEQALHAIVERTVRH